MNNKMDSMSSVEIDLKQKLYLLAESSLEDGNHAACSFINEFLDIEPFDVKMGEYLYASDISSWMNEIILEASKKLLSNNADVGWYMLLQSASDEEEELSVIRDSIMNVYSKGIELDTVQEIYSHLSTADEFQEEISVLINNANAENIRSDIEDDYQDKKQLVDELNVLNEFKRMSEELRHQLEPLSLLKDIQVRLSKLDEINVISEQISSLAATNKVRAKLGMMEKDILKKRQQIDQQEKELKKADLTIRLLRKEKENLQMHLERNLKNEEAVTLKEELRFLQERETSLVEKLDQEKEKSQSLSEDKEEMELVIVELREQNQDLTTQLNDTQVQLEQRAVQNEKKLEEESYSYPEEQSIDQNLKSEPVFWTKSESVPRENVTSKQNDMDEIDIFTELGWDTTDIREIVPDKVGLIERIKNFARIHSKYYEKQYQKRPVSEQENLLFVKMMELHFSKEKVLLVKNILQTKKTISRVDLYKFLTMNPTEDELTKYCENAA